MQNRPIYRDLLKHGIAEHELQRFINQLYIDQQGSKKVLESQELDTVIYARPKQQFFTAYNSGLCFSIAYGQSNITEALLKAGADPNLFNPYIGTQPALITAALRSDQPNRQLQNLLATPNIDIYLGKVVHSIPQTIFFYVDPALFFYLFLLDPAAKLLINDSDPENVIFCNEVITKGCKKLTHAVANQMTYTANGLICDTAGKMYARTEEIENSYMLINEKFGRLSAGPIVISYLSTTSSFFLKKPVSLQKIEHLQTELRPSTNRRGR